MTDEKRQIVVCSCEDTMPLDMDTLRRACRGEVTSGRQFCRAELDRFRKLAAGGDPITVACTQEAPVFAEVAAEIGDPDIVSANIRENAGWSKGAAQAGPKIAALLAMAAEPVPDVPFVSFNSEGIILIYGRDERAIEAAALLKDHLDVTVMISRPKDLPPRRTTEYPIVQGTIRSAKGYLGKFEVGVDDYAQSAPSSRDKMVFGAARSGVTSHCDIILDVSGGAPLFPAADLRDGYLRADPGDPAAILRVALKARDLVGTFDKPRYVNFKEDLCAHSRSRIVGCTRCLDLCPAGAITPAGDHVAIDPHICAGCGQCAAACPTGAAGYALPPADGLMQRLRVLLTAYREAGGSKPVLLFHDETHGVELIDALARHGDGLPPNALPVAVNEVTQVGLEAIAASFAYGAAAIRFLLRARPRHDVAGLRRTIELAYPILSGLGFGANAVAAIETDDPDALGESLRAIATGEGTSRPASFRAVGGKRDVLRLSNCIAPRRRPWM
jgi:ferredoxin